VIPLLALASVFYGASQVFSTGLQVAGKTRVMPKVILAAALGNAALNLALIPQLHEVGAALATAITNLLLCAGMLVGSRRVFPIPFETGRLLRIVVTAGFLLFCGDALGALPLAAGIAARVGLLALFGPMLVLSGGISRGELRSVPGVLGTIIGGDR
jgi:O-antigen/teichoic acid export membrane protein